MKYTDYTKGKELFIANVFIKESELLGSINEQYNAFVWDNNIEEFITECEISNIADEMFLPLNEAEGGSNFFMRMIGKTKLKNNVKKYANAYLAWKMAPIELMKLKKTPRWEKMDQDQRNHATEAQKIKVTADGDAVSAIEDRMEEIAKRYGVDNVLGMYKTKAKLAALTKVRTVAKGMYSDSEYSDLENTYKNLQNQAKKADETLAAQQKEESKVDKVAAAKENGFVPVSKEQIDSGDYDVISLQDKQGKTVIVGKKKANAKPADTKPADAKPADANPAETKKADKIAELESTIKDFSKNIEDEMKYKQGIDSKIAELEKEKETATDKNSIDTKINKLKLESSKSLDDMKDMQKKMKETKTELDKINK